MSNKLEPLRQNEKIAFKIIELLKGKTYQEIANILIIVRRIIEENAVYK